MALVVVDTDILIDHLRGENQAVQMVTALAGAGRLRTTTINLFELLSGATEGRRGDVVRRLAEVLEALPLDRKAATCAAGIRRDLDGVGQSIGMGDSLIAGICVTHRLPLLTRNIRHFSRVRELQLEDIDSRKA